MWLTDKIGKHFRTGGKGIDSKDFIKMRQQDSKRAKGELTPSQQRVYNYIKKYGASTDDDIAGDTEMPIMIARNALDGLKAAGKIKVTTKSGRTAYEAVTA